MDQITAQQAAEKWNLSIRTVQDLCAKGRLDGAERWGRVWMIPADADKPIDGRTKTARQKETEPPRILMPRQTPNLIMSDLYCTSGSGETCVKKLAGTPEVSAIFSAWLSWGQGNVQKALEITLPLLRAKTDFYGTLNIGTLLMACALWQNDISLWHTGRAHVAGVRCANEYEQKIRDLWLGINDAGVLTNIRNLNWYYWGEFEKLPTDSLPAVWFYYARHMHKIARSIARGDSAVPDIHGLGMMQMYPFLAEPLIAQVQRVGSLMAELCIRFLCADAYLSIGLREQGIHHLDLALSLALPDKLYGVLAEFRGLFYTLMDERLERMDADAAEAVKRIYKDMIGNWGEMKNRPITITLSERQSEIAQLAAIGLSNGEIAKRLDVSIHTVKSTISMIMNKTGTKKRSEFSRYIF